MRILVVSDTHGDISNVERLLSKDKNFEMIIHLGDCCRDAANIERKYPEIQVEAVYGNCDFMVGEVPSERLIEVGGKRIFATHGHIYSVKYGTDRLVNTARDMKADILLFGHTHVSSLIEGEDYVLLNPGSISNSRDGFGESYAIIEIRRARLTYEICQV